jgi:hypothetical protein
MLELLIAVHNITRWLVVILAAIALVRSWSGWLGKRSWGPLDRKLGMYFGIGMDIQLLLGGILWFAGAWGLRALQTMAGAGREALFFATEHSLTMLIAVVFTHVGSVMARKAKDDTSKHRQAAIWFTLAVLLVLMAIPWTQRALLPF